MALQQPNLLSVAQKLGEPILTDVSVIDTCNINDPDETTMIIIPLTESDKVALTSKSNSPEA